MELRKYEFTEEMMNQLREKGEIPVNFYNKEGQVLIHKKEEASLHEINALMRFTSQGVYFDQAEIDKLLMKPAEEAAPAGLTNTRLLSEQTARDLTTSTTEIFSALKSASFSNIHAQNMTKKLDRVFTDFASQEDAMTGLVNIIDLMKNEEADFDIESAVKRTVVAMAIKTRGMQSQKKTPNLITMAADANALMMSSLLSHVGKNKIDMPQDRITAQDMIRMRRYPYLSYMMLANVSDVDPQVKSLILNQNRCLPEDSANNNFPSLKWLRESLRKALDQVKSNPSKQILAKDLMLQIDLLEKNASYIDDVNTLTIAAQFASLTSNTPWREAFDPETASKLIINDSFFTLAPRSLREFLDFVSVSLCGNKMILKPDDYLVLAVISSTEKFHFEIVKILRIDRYQSRPLVQRLANIELFVNKTHKLVFSDLDSKSIMAEKRKAIYDLSKDHSRRIVYIIDQALDEKMYNIASKLG